MPSRFDYPDPGTDPAYCDPLSPRWTEPHDGPMPRTHYLPAFTVRGAGTTQRAACGVYIQAVRHSLAPTCVDCAQFLEGLVARTDYTRSSEGADR